MKLKFRHYDPFNDYFSYSKDFDNLYEFFRQYQLAVLGENNPILEPGFELNGNDFYVGDIAKLSAEEPISTEQISTDYDWEIISEIVFENTSFWFRFDKVCSFHILDLFEVDADIEIIGNIHQNKDLLDET